MHKHPSCSARVAAGKGNLLRRLYGQTFSSLLKEAAALCRSSRSVFSAEAREPTCWALVWGAVFIRQEGMQSWFYKQQSCKQVWAFSRALLGRTPSGHGRWRLSRAEGEWMQIGAHRGRGSPTALAGKSKGFRHWVTVFHCTSHSDFICI